MSNNEIVRDKLFLLKPNFEDPAYPGRRFYCWHCALIKGVLSAFPKLACQFDIERVSWERPRIPVVTLVGEEFQDLPLLVLAKGESSKFQTGSVNGRTLISDKDRILLALSERYGFPESHP